MAGNLRVTQTTAQALGGSEGKLRTTATNVSALGGSEGKLRVTQSYVQVMFEQLLIERTIEDSLTLVQVLHSNIETPDIEDVLVIVQDHHRSLYTEGASNDLELEDTVHVNVASLSVTQELPLTHTATGVLTAQSLSSVLDLIDIAALAPGSERQQNTSNFLAMEDEVDVHYGVANISVEDTLAGDGEVTTLLQDAVNLVWSLELESVLTLTDEALRVFSVSNTLAIVDEVEFARGLLVEDVISLVDEVSVTQILQREIEDDLGIEDVVTYFIEADDTECTYSPFLGAGSPVSATPPDLSGTATLTLTYPYISPTSTLVLRNPELGNSERHEFTRIARQTRGGTLEVFADDVWSKTKTLILEINDLTQAQSDDFLDFLGDSLGKEIGLLDWENRQWRGIITTPDAEVTDQGRSCRKNIRFEFEGELV